MLPRTPQGKLDRDAFIAFWNRAGSAAEVAAAFGTTVNHVSVTAYRLRKRDCRVKKMPNLMAGNPEYARKISAGNPFRHDPEHMKKMRRMASGRGQFQKGNTYGAFTHLRPHIERIVTEENAHAATLARHRAHGRALAENSPTCQRQSAGKHPAEEAESLCG